MSRYPKSIIKKKPLRIIFRAFLILAGILVILYLIAFTYVSSHKKAIISEVTTELGKKMNGKITVTDVELSFFRHFPKISVVLHDVSVTDSMYAQHKHIFFRATHLFAQLSITKLLRKQPPLNGLTIENGSLYLYTDTSGYTNTYLLSQKESSSGPDKIERTNELKSVTLKEVSFILDDRKKEKLHNFFIKGLELKTDEEDGTLLLETEANVLIHGMGFNMARGSFLRERNLTGKFELRYNKLLNQLQFDSIDIALSGQPFNLSGRFDLKGNAPQFSLRAHARRLLYNEGKSLMTEKIARSLSMAETSQPLDVDADISGPLKGGEPLIYVSWKAKGTQLKTPFLDFDNASFSGYFTNEVVKGLPRNDPNSKITVSNFLADWHAMPLTSGKIEILNLEKPVLTCDLVSDFPLTKLNNLIKSNSLQLQSGDGSVNLTYKGPIEKNNNTNSFLNGTVLFKNGNILYTPRNVEMKGVNGKILFKDSDVFITDLSCVVLNNKISMEGQAKNLLTLINTEPGKAGIDWTISTPSLNLGAFTFLLKPDKKATTPNTKASAVSAIDDVLEKASFHVKLHTPALYYKKFEAGDVTADISLLEDRYVINDVSMAHAAGSIHMNGSLVRQKGNDLQATINASMDNVDVSKVLNAFDNFGQDGIKSQNLAGKLTANINASLGLTEDAVVQPASIKSTIDFSLKNGALINYEPVKKLQNFLFKHRDFENIRFAELKDSLEIANRDIRINRMEIQSTVLSFFVEGVYSMKGNSDISIQVPLSNLKKRDSGYIPENIGVHKKAGKSIFLRGRPGDDGNISFKLDLFNRYKKEKQNSGKL